MPYLGAHMSIAGGIYKAFDHIMKVKGESLQIFTKNQRQWNAKPYSAGDITLFHEKWEEAGNIPVAAHASYLVNLGSGKQELVAKSVKALVDEMQRCDLLGVPWLVLHPGSHGGDGVEIGIERVATHLDRVFETAGKSRVIVLLETTAGQGTGLGHRFEELGAIIDQSKYPDRLGVCVDTCHIFAAGYDIRSKETYQQTFTQFDEIIGISRIRFFHLNDSKKDLGSRVDRHEHIGKGKIGLEGFRQLLNDPRFAHHPMTLETPKGKDLAEDIENLAVLHSLM